MKTSHTALNRLVKRLPRMLAASAICLTSVTLPVIAADYFYDHNGSRMRVNITGAKVNIFYADPRVGLARNGVVPGTLLFDGRVSNNYLEGMTRIFHPSCGVVDYFVYGDFRPGRDFKLNGAAPVLSGMSCRIVDNIYDGPNANLAFTATGTSAPVRSGCLKNVSTSLNVRVGPGSDYGRIHELPAGTCGIRVLPDCRDGWCVVEAGPALGWVSMNYVQQ